MKPRAFLAAIILAVLTAIPTVASAAFVHYFDCNLCHRDGAAWNTVDAQGVCISCHDSAGGAFDFGAPNPIDGLDRIRPNDGATGATIPPGFSTGDASNAFGNGNLPFAQNSHNWGAADSNPAAGASPASTALYNTKRGAARGFVACYKCHDPHSAYDADYATGNEKMLRTAALPTGDGTSQNTEQNIEAMCTECHLDWASVVGADRGLKSHPMYAGDYTADFAADPRFKPFAGAGSMALLAGNKIGCSTCHGIHATDSGGANDGKILKGPGASVDGQAICASCHTYMAHPGTETLGCLVCHSGHSYNDGTPNYFVLRSDVTTATYGSKTGLRYTDIPTFDGGTADVWTIYAGPNGNDGYCTGCHGDITGTGPGQPSAVQKHTATDDCNQCHQHFDPNNPTDPSFVPKGCTNCHGQPPRQNIAGGDPNAGYASDLAGTGFDYNTNNGSATFLNEANTPHATHAFSNPVASNISCKTCHNAHIDNFNTQHNNSTTGPTFQNVLEGIYTMLPLATGNGATSPSYNGGTWTCSAVYCHSNGNMAALQTAAPGWNGTNGTITGCTACHDDNTSSIGAGTKNNTAAHDKHVTRYDAVDVAGKSCNVCHSDTTDGLTITTPANHVNTTVELATDAAFVIDTVSNAALGGGTLSAASCSVYCHSDGNGNFSNPSWGDTGPTGAGSCGKCHSVDPATIDALQVNGAHVLHLSDPNGPLIASCDVCHTHDGSFAPNNGHIDKSKAVKADACDACHGKPGGGWTAAGTVDESPVWTDPTTVRCDTCHSGTVSVINAASAPLVDETAYGNGHGKTGVAQVCTDCHEANTVAGHLGGATITRLSGTLPAFNATNDVAFCTDCHAATTNNHNVIDGTICRTCHAQHGEANGFDAMIKSNIAGNTVAGFTTQGVRSSYVNASFTGVCQTCHTTAQHFSKTLYEDATHNPGQACSDCHKHDATPAFTGIGDSCDSCHGFPPKTGAHVVHAPDSDLLDQAGKVYVTGLDRSACAYCHTGADSYTYQPSVDRVGGFNHGDSTNSYQGKYDILTTTVNYNKANGSCGAGACHQADATRADWAAGFNFPTACDACHGNPPTSGGGDGQAHPKHIAAGLVCGTCHDSTPVDTSHINTYTGATELAKVQSMTNALAANVSVTEASWVANADRTCSTATCHDPSGTGFAANWDTSDSTGNCALCHVDTTGDPTTGSHTAHRVPSTASIAGGKIYTAPIACNECHVVPVSTAHRNGLPDVPLDGLLATSGTATPAGTNYDNGTGVCSATYCHDGSLIGGSSGYSDPGANTAPTWGDAAYLDGTQANDCNQCHDAPPNPAKVPSAHPNNTNCNSCHDNTTAVTNDSFIDPSLHDNGIVDGGGDFCTDCHNAADIDGALSGAHAKHADIATFFGTKSITAGDNGGAGWYGTTYVSGQPKFGCGECHPGEGLSHPANGLNVDIDPAGETPGAGNVKLLNGAQNTPTFISRTSVTCASVYCHSNAVGSYKTTPDWYGGSVSGNCNECHGNWPTTNAHQMHQISIHYGDIYTGTTGVLTPPGAVDPVDHGTATVSTLSCQVCHNATVTISRNDEASACSSCHTGEGNKMVVSTTSMTHINGQKDVIFENAVFKSKAQLRDDITTVAEVNNYWTRSNYKSASATAVDSSNAPLQGTASWDGATCSTVACHNGNAATWTDSGMDCTYCHKDLPK